MLNLLYAPSSGKIFFGDTDASEVPLDHLRKHVAMVVQENSVFSGTVTRRCWARAGPACRGASGNA